MLFDSAFIGFVIFLALGKVNYFEEKLIGHRGGIESVLVELAIETLFWVIGIVRLWFLESLFGEILIEILIFRKSFFLNHKAGIAGSFLNVQFVVFEI
jgi:hypothetical protein